MSLSNIYPGGVWLCDFEFHPRMGVDGNPPEPVCMVAMELTTKQKIRIWKDELLQLDKAPFQIDESTLFVAYYLSAEISCFLSLGWAPPLKLLDLFTEFRCMTNGSPLPHGSGILGALTYFGKSGINAEEKTAMRDMVLRGGPWSATEQKDILDYCESDVLALAELLPSMEKHIDLPRALLRGEYMCAAAHIESIGIPVDLSLYTKLVQNWDSIQDRLIELIDQEFGVFEGRSFKSNRWGEYLEISGIAWPRLASGALDLKNETFKEMSHTFPQISPMKELRDTLSKLRLANLSIGEDARNRYLLSAFSSTTSRNQPCLSG